MLESFFNSTDFATLERVNEWKITRNGELVYFELPAKDGEIYRLRLGCDNYPQQAPSVIFVDSEGTQSNPRAWPNCSPVLLEIIKPPPNCFLCTELTREGLHHHQDWRSQSKSWNGAKNSLIDIFNLVHRLLHSDGYLGRGGF